MTFSSLEHQTQKLIVRQIATLQDHITEKDTFSLSVTIKLHVSQISQYHENTGDSLPRQSPNAVNPVWLN